MRISRIYFGEKLASETTAILSADISHYLGKVLRLKSGDQIHLFNETDGEFLASVSNVKKSAVEVDIGSMVRAAEAATLQINLALGISRGDRMDYGIQKSSELGVSRITPLYTEYGEVRLKADRVENKLRHWSKIAVSASEQSGRLDIAEVTAPCGLEQWARDLPVGLNIMLEPSGSQQLSAELSSKLSLGLSPELSPELSPQLSPQQQNSQNSSVKNVNLIIGPEGGFSAKEIQWAEQAGFLITSLGKRILRTETAPVASLAIIQHLFGDM
jgi:16S rRNA (uracil1498-N3)-methyltransferase